MEKALDTVLKALKLLKYTEHAITRGHSLWTVLSMIILIAASKVSLGLSGGLERWLETDDDPFSVPIHMRTEAEIWTLQADSQLRHELLNHVQSGGR